MLSSFSSRVQKYLYFAGIRRSWQGRGASRPGWCRQGLGLAEHDGPGPFPLRMVQLSPSLRSHPLRSVGICTEKDRAQHPPALVLHGKGSQAAALARVNGSRCLKEQWQKPRPPAKDFFYLNFLKPVSGWPQSSGNHSKIRKRMGLPSNYDFTNSPKKKWTHN